MEEKNKCPLKVQKRVFLLHLELFEGATTFNWCDCYIQLIGGILGFCFYCFRQFEVFQELNRDIVNKLCNHEHEDKTAIARFSVNWREAFFRAPWRRS